MHKFKRVLGGTGVWCQESGVGTNCASRAGIRIPHPQRIECPGACAMGKQHQQSTRDRDVLLEMQQLIAVAVALTTQCPYCIEIHNKAARNAGATDVQLAEAAMVAMVMRAGAAVTHASHLFAD